MCRPCPTPVDFQSARGPRQVGTLSTRIGWVNGRTERRNYESRPDDVRASMMDKAPLVSTWFCLRGRACKTQPIGSRNQGEPCQDSGEPEGTMPCRRGYTSQRGRSAPEVDSLDA